MRRLLPFLSLFSLVGLLGCGSLSFSAKGPQSIVDSDIWSEDCHPYTFPKDLPVIDPQSPGSTAMDPASAPRVAVIRSTKCGSSLRVVQLIPSGDPVKDPTSKVMTQGYSLKDISPLAAVEMMRTAPKK